MDAVAARVSIIITSRNRATHLRETLASFQRLQQPQGLSYEVLVVDNASTDDTAAVVNAARAGKLPVRYLYEARQGQSNARNAGLASTSGEVILFTDDDVRVPPDWIERMSTDILARKADAVAGGVRLAPHLERPWMRRVHRAYVASTDYMKSPQVRTLVGANMAFSRSVLTRVPGFDPELGPGALGFGDDTLFAAQILEAGLRIAGALDCQVEHHFEPARLTRCCFLADAAKRGRTKAYLDRHWYHRTISRPRLRRIAQVLRLLQWRLRHAAERREEEGCDEQELTLVRNAHWYGQWLVEARRTPNYEVRGLRRRAVRPTEA